MVNKEILKTIENYLRGKNLTYEDYIKILSEDKINSFFNKVLSDRTVVCQNEIENFSKEENVNELYSIFLETHNVTINEEEAEDSLSDDIVQQYLQEISKYPLLSYEEEQKVCRVFSDHLKELRNDESIDKSNGLKQYLTKEEQEAYEYFVNCNYRLVVSIAKRYNGRGLSFADLIQEGNMGLLRAVDKFDVDTGYKFSTYAIWWIKQCIVRSLADNGKTIRMPVHLVEFFNKVNAIAMKYYAEKEAMPSNREVAIAYLELDPKNITKEDEEKINEIVKKIEDNVLINQDLVSLDLRVGEDEETTLEDFIADDKESIEKVVMRNLLKEDFKKIFSDKDGLLTEREMQILALRYGLYDGERRTLEEVGKVFGITRERIRQIEGKALRKLRQSKELQSYAEDFSSFKTRSMQYTLSRTR